MEAQQGGVEAETAELEAVPVLAGLIGRLHRALRKRVRENFVAPALPQSQIEVLGLLHRTPGLRVHELSALLGLAPNTASTVLQQLLRLGYVQRQVDLEDRRSARLTLTEAARQRMARWRDTRGVVLARTLEALPSEDQQAIIAALPALARLTATLEASSQ